MHLNGLSDQQIWSSFKKGEDWALSFIYSEYADKLYHYGLKFTADILIIEDSLQDLFTELIKRRKFLGETDHILYYLMKSYKRKLLRNLQSEKKIIQNNDLEWYTFDVVWSIEHELILEEASQYNVKTLLKALSNLTPRQKEAIYLRFTKELDYHSIAGIMDISIEACRNLISKAIASLKKVYTDKNQDALLLFIITLAE